MQYRKYLAVGILLLLFSGLRAQQNERYTLSGYVRDTFGKPIYGATVKPDNGQATVMTETDGFYRLDGLTGSSVTVQIHAVGYQDQKLTVPLLADKETHRDFQLAIKEEQLAEVSVVGKTDNQQKVLDIKHSGYSVNVIDLNVLSNRTADLNQVLRRTPGVTIRENGGMGSDFAFKINGLDAKIFIDGIPMENFGSSMTLNNIPVNLVDRVEVYKGVVPAYLTTDVLGGAVNIITKQRSRKFFDLSYAYGSLNTHQASGIANVADAKTGLAVKASAFFNHSDNDYRMYSNEKYGISLKGDVNSYVDENGVTQSKLVEVAQARRFYDAYTSGMGKVELGYENKPWADRFLVGLTYAKNKNQLQLGSGINDLYGGRWSDNNYIMPTIQYRKNGLFTPGLFVDIFSSYADSRTDVQDTARYIYYWSGNPVSLSGLREPSHFQYKNKSYIARTDFSYYLNKQKSQVLSLNYNFTTNKQVSYDLLEELENYRDLSGLPKRLGKHIANLSWQGQWLDDKLSTVLMAKYYGMDVRNTMDERMYDSDGNLTGGAVNEHHEFFDYKSAGLTLRYLLKKDVGVKASLERAYRLPSITELFGDGINVLPNVNIQPERSDNLNAGAFYNTFIHEDHYINVDITGFLRNAANYFQQRPLDTKFQYQNIPGARLYGFEFDVKYGYKDLISFSLNGSHDKAVVSQRYTDETKSEELLVYKEQLPNRPWIYGNADLTLSQKDLLGKGTRVELTYLNQYIHWFYLSFANLGDPGTKNYVPSQYIQSALLGFSWKYNRYGISLEARNLTNELAYDNFRLQKPGRTFYLKLRMSVM